jgi:GntR family transcriptional regulator
MFQMSLNPDSRVPIYRQIEDQVRYAIALGKLKPGDQLPTVRALAVDLSVNPNTVIKAYTELERDGVITTEQGTGTFVSPEPPDPVPKSQRRAKLESLVVEFISHASVFGFTPQEILEAVQGHVARGGGGARERKP